MPGMRVRWSLVAALILFVLPRSSYVTRQHEAREQPVPFYHAHHVGSMGVDCRYCHTSVAKSSQAGIPPTATCMNCHSQISRSFFLIQGQVDIVGAGCPLNFMLGCSIAQIGACGC